MLCPCGSRQDYSNCCQPIHQGLFANTPEKLMRARYSAYALGDLGTFLFNSWHPDTRSGLSAESLQQTDTHWQKLEVLDHQHDQDTGEVEFKAWYLEQNELHCLHERSRFQRTDGQWFYLDGDILPSTKHSVGRNDPCPCGSGRKFKKCCGR